MVGSVGLYAYGLHWVRSQEKNQIIHQQAAAIEQIAKIKVVAAKPPGGMLTNVHPNARVTNRYGQDAQVHRAEPPVEQSVEPPAPPPVPPRPANAPVGYEGLSDDLAVLAQLLPRMRPAKIHTKAKNILSLDLPPDRSSDVLALIIDNHYRQANLAASVKVDLDAWRGR